MSSRETGHLQSKVSGFNPILLALAAVASLGFAVFAVSYPLPLLAVVLVVVVGYYIISRPDTATLLVIFIIFTNAAVVAVKFHGVPMIAGAAFPLILAFPLAYYLWHRREKLILTKIVPLIVLFECIRFLSALFADRPDVATGEMLTSVTEGLGLYLLLTNVIRTPEMLRRVCWTILAAGAFLGSLNAYQYLAKDYDNNLGGFGQNENKAAFAIDADDPSTLQPRLEGPIGEQNYYAQCMLMMFSIALLRGFGEPRFGLKTAATIGSILILFGIVLTFSRGAIVGFGAIVLTLVFLRRITFKQFGIVLLCGTLVMLVVPQFRTRLQSFEKLVTLVSPQSEGIATVDRSTQGRLSEMIAAGLVFADHPVLGVGPGMFKYHFTKYANATGTQVHTKDRNAHNLYLQVAAECGLFGILCLLSILYLTMKELLRIIKSSDNPELVSLSTGILLALIGFSTTSLFLDYAYIRFFWAIMALAGAAGYLFSSELRTKSGLQEHITTSSA